MTVDSKGATLKSSIRFEMAQLSGKYRTLLSIAICFVFYCAGTTGEPDIKVTLEKLAPCNDKSSSLGDISGLKVSKINKTAIGFNGKVIANYDITDDTTVHASISKLSAGRWAALPINIPAQNICQFIQKDKEYYPVLQRNSNLPKHCPIPKGEYTLNKAVLVVKKIPSFIPKGCFKVELTISNKNLNHPSCYIVVAKIAGASDGATPSCLA